MPGTEISGRPVGIGIGSEISGILGIETSGKPVEGRGISGSEGSDISGRGNEGSAVGIDTAGTGSGGSGISGSPGIEIGGSPVGNEMKGSEGSKMSGTATDGSAVRIETAEIGRFGMPGMESDGSAGMDSDSSWIPGIDTGGNPVGRGSARMGKTAETSDTILGISSKPLGTEIGAEGSGIPGIDGNVTGERPGRETPGRDGSAMLATATEGKDTA